MPKTTDNNKYSHIPTRLKSFINNHIPNEQTKKLALSRMDNILRQDITISELMNNADNVIEKLPKLYSARNVKNP